MESKCSLPHSQEITTGFNFESVEVSITKPYLLKIYFNLQLSIQSDLLHSGFTVKLYSTDTLYPAGIL